MKVIKNYIWNMLYQVISVLVPILLIPYVNRKLGPTGVGMNSYTNSLAQIFMALGDLGVTNYGTKIISTIRYDKYILSKDFIEITLMRFLTILLAYSLYLCIIIYQGQYIKFYLLQGIVILASIFDISWFFMGIEHFKVISLKNIIIKLMTIIFVFVFVHDRYDTGIYIGIISVSNLFGNLSVWPSLKNKICIVRISVKDLFKHLRYAIIFFIPQISMQIYQTLYKFVLGKIVNIRATGFFDNSDKIMNILLTVISSLSMVMLPHISNMLNYKSIKVVKHYFYAYFDVVLCLSIPMTFGVSSICLRFAPWFFGSSFAVDGKLMMIESLTIFIIGISLALSSYFIATNQIKPYNMAIIFGALFSVTIGIYLIHLLGLVGSMWGTVFTEMFITIYEFMSLYKQLSITKMFRHFWVYLIGSLLLFIIVITMNLNLCFNIYTLIIEIIIGVFIYILILILFKIPIINYLKKFLVRLF